MIFIRVCVCVYLCERMRYVCVNDHTQKLEKGVGSLGAGVRVDSEPPSTSAGTYTCVL